MARSPDRSRSEAAGWRSRLAAAELVWAATAKGSDLETAMAANGAFRRLEGADRGFARAMASAALRGMGRIDWALGGMVQRPLTDIEAPVLALLRVGAAQLWLLNVAEHAAVSATVEAAAKWDAARRGGGLINAVLRRAAREAEAFVSAPVEAVWPDWLAAKLKSALGPARAEALAQLQLEEPSVDLTVRDAADAVDWADRLGGELLPNGSIRLASAAGLADLPGYAEGAWWVQDAAASLPAMLLGDIAGRDVADLCAAPGGKAMQLAARGARLSAVEISAQRMERLRENVARTGLQMDLVQADARSWRPAGPLDAVLLDAPCSALGIVRRHPEGVWRRDPKDLARFPAIQQALVAAAADMLKPGGRLVYAVCTPATEEGRDIVDAAVASGVWRRAPIRAGEIPGFECALTSQGDVLTAPAATETEAPQTRTDVFYIARLERN
ncbi:MAG: transcription antitermination factor NusB [Hyphomonadaceae bacterium]